MRLSTSGFSPGQQEDFGGEKRCLNSELWHACAGPLVSLPTVGSRVVYFPQGHSEQVAASTNKEVDAQFPNHPSLPPQLLCQLHNVTMHADVDTDEVYAQMTLQPLSPQEQKNPYPPSDFGASSKQPNNYFCKTLTASDTSTHGGFSVPRRAAEKVFPPLDFSQQPPAQELIARDIHDKEWKFRHIFRGQPKRHLLTTGWSVFVSAKRLVAGDSVLFIWNEKNQLLLGIRRASRPQTVMPSSVLSSDSMHLGLLAAAAHAAATNSRFTIFYNPRASPSEFVIPLSKYIKAVYHTNVSVGMRFRMLFETEESSVRRYMGTITGISDSDPVRWPNSHWRSVKVGWDESTAGEKQPRVSLWEIEPLTTFPMYPSAFPFRLKRPWPPGLPSFYGMKDDELGMNAQQMWLRGNNNNNNNNGDRGIQSLNFQGPLMQQPRLDPSLLGLQTQQQQSDMYQAMAAAALQEMRAVDPSMNPLQFQSQSPQIIPNRSAISLAQPLMVHHQPHLNLENSQSHLLQQQLQQNPFYNPNCIQQSQFASPSPSITSLCSQPSFSNTNPNIITTNPIVSPLHSLLGSFHREESVLNPLRNSTGWVPKQGGTETLLPERISHANGFGNSISLPPFPGKECSIDQEGNTADPQNNLLFGVNIEAGGSLLVQNGMTGFRGVSAESDSSGGMPFASSNFMTSDNFGHSSSVDDSGFLSSPQNVDLQCRAFVKVHMTGTFGRSLDIAKFSSYKELRRELGRMFGLEGQLDEPLRSGWQLVFVDREGDTLLLGDGPWPEFVNSVESIRIRSPQEVLQSVPIQKLAGSR